MTTISLRLQQTPRLLRYLLVGGGLFVLDVAVFAGLVAVDVPIPVAQFLARATGAAAGFVGHRQWTFASQADGHRLGLGTQSVAYLGVTVFNLLLSPPLVSAAVAWSPWPAVVAKAAIDVALVAETYLLLNVVFAPRRTP